jgi:hypothetical protein
MCGCEHAFRLRGNGRDIVLRDVRRAVGTRELC